MKWKALWSDNTFDRWIILVIRGYLLHCNSYVFVTFWTITRYKCIVCEPCPKLCIHKHVLLLFIEVFCIIFIRQKTTRLVKYSTIIYIYLLGEINVPVDAIISDSSTCTQHYNDIDSFYSSICDKLALCTEKCIPHVKLNSKVLVHGWNEFVKSSHQTAREAFL